MRRRYNFQEKLSSNDSLNSEKYEKSRKNNYGMSAYVGILFVIILFALYGLVYVIDNNLPTALKLSDEQLHQDAFIAERAQHDLKLLTDLGPRIVGSYENEIMATEFLKREIGFIQQRAHKNQMIEMDWQVVEGSYYWNTTPSGFILAYSNVQNVIVKLHSRKNSEHSILVNAHYDSVPTSPGGSDDGINCAVMLEIIRKLSRAKERPLHNIIFLFNGAEETGLLAAHGFITKHKWAKESKVIINLEAAGAGGKIILFQSGPSTPWLMKYYQMVPHPYGQAAGEEIFQNNLIPSDTDFRIFRDFGGLVGVDMAFIKNGYRYHTKYDDYQNIPSGSFQHVGDNALSLIKNFANAPEVGDKSLEGDKVIYFDLLGFFMIVYTEFSGIIINYCTVIFSILIAIKNLYDFKLGQFKQIFKSLSWNFLAVILGWISAGLFIYLLAVFLDVIHYTMSWYANPWIIFGLYAVPGILCPTIILQLINENTLKNLAPNTKCHIQAHIIRLIWSFLLLIGTTFNIRAMYSITVPVIFNCLAFLIISIFKLQHSVRKWQVIYILSLIPSTIFLMNTCLTTIILFIPVTGRIGSDKNPEMIIGLLSLVYTILITSPFIPLVTLLRDVKYLIIFLLSVFVVNVLIVFTPLGFPYTGNADAPKPERFWILHTRRTFYGEYNVETKRDSGYFLLNMDRNSPHKVIQYVNEINKAKSLDDDCNKYLLCGMPLAHAKMMEVVRHSTWIPAGQPVISQSTKFEVLSKTNLSETVIRLNISVTGPDRLGIYLSPKHGVKLINISLLDVLPSEEETFKWNGRSLYFIKHTYAKEPAPFIFYFDVKVPENYKGVIAELATTGFHVHDKDNMKVPHFIEFLNKFPNWADLTVWLATYDSWFI